MKPVRCAIYTRKSTEEGLEQEFNSLDAQREAAEAYILSQKHLGWTVLDQHYDDGGFSGGTLERPALQQLLSDMEAGLLDCVLVYKVDRLSRSLLDFARLMDRFERAQVSFVSVTQQFNTTASLGRLTLNILLSFAQFEREIISERTRDKMAAARKKGKWVGGTPVLGYDVDPKGGRLVVNEPEAARVREIFSLYRQHRSLETVVLELNRRNWRTKSWKSRRGRKHVGCHFTKASLTHLLTNLVFAGKIHYRGTVYPGEHPAIVDCELWEQVNQEFRLRQRTKTGIPRQAQQALLAGRLRCEHCQRPMIPTYSIKRNRRYRYYVCRRDCRVRSVPAALLEDSLRSQLGIRLRNEESFSPADRKVFAQDPDSLIPVLVDEIRYDGRTGTVRVKLREPKGLSFEYQAPIRKAQTLPPFPNQQTAQPGAPLKLARLLALGHKLERLVRTGEAARYQELARSEGVSPSRIAQLAMLTQLAPQIQEYVLFLSAQHAGRITELQLRHIAQELSWDRQTALFGQLLARRSS